MTAVVTAPLELLKENVKDEWIDYNGHMNVAFYMLAFDLAVDRLFGQIGLDQDYLRRCNASSFTLEAHIGYAAELTRDEPFSVYMRLLDFDHKRMHIFLEMYKDRSNELSATAEFIMMHMDMNMRRSSPYPEFIYTALAEIYETQKDLPRHENTGHVIGIRRKTDQSGK